MRVRELNKRLSEVVEEYEKDTGMCVSEVTFKWTDLRNTRFKTPLEDPDMKVYEVETKFKKEDTLVYDTRG